ncbi:hypothetical protein SKB0120_25140 (plasmid) [Moraxella osloensis]
MAVTKSDVLRAIEQLEANDQKPTNANILEITGGSNATVNKYRSEILNERLEQSFENKIRLNENELMAVSTVFDRILSSRLLTLRAEYEAHIANSENTITTLLNKMEVLEDLLSEKNNELLVMNHELTEAKAKVSLIQENATAEKENLNKQLFELAKESGKVEFLNSKVEQLERENSEYKRMIENNRKVDEKQQSLLDQPEATSTSRSKKTKATQE